WLEPRHALPAIRPRCCFLYLTFLGINMAWFSWARLFLLVAAARLGRSNFLFPGRLRRGSERRHQGPAGALRQLLGAGLGLLRRPTGSGHGRPAIAPVPATIAIRTPFAAPRLGFVAESQA